MKKQLFLLSLVLLSLMPMRLLAQTTYHVPTNCSLETAVGYDNAIIILDADIQLGSYLNIDGKTLTISLNGHKIYRNITDGPSSEGHVVYVHNDATLTLNNSTGTGRIEGGMANNGGAMFIEPGSTVSATGVTFQNNSAAEHAGAIWNAGSLTLDNCTISSNTAGDVGGIYNAVVDNTYCGTATLTDCTLTGNSSNSSAGALGNAEGATTMTLDNCTITGNTAGTNGGGIWNGGTLTITGGNITGNTATVNGGGIYHLYGTLNMDGNPVILRNTGNSKANDVYLSSSKVITVTGAFTEGTRIGIKPSSTSQTMTSGYSSYNSGVDPNIYFYANDDYYFPTLSGGEVKQSIPAISYIDAAGNTQTHTNCHKLSYLLYSGGTEMGTYTNQQPYNTDWYVVDEDLTFDSRLFAQCNIHLILTDGHTLTAHKGIDVSASLSKSLTIYGQSAQTGTIIVDNPNNYYAGIGGGIDPDELTESNPNGYFNSLITINGGIINVKGGYYAAGIGASCQDPQHSLEMPITINGGNVTATGGNWAAGIGGGRHSSVYPININGGTVHATGGTGSVGIGSGAITSTPVVTSIINLNWTSATDNYYSTGYDGTVTVADGKTFVTSNGLVTGLSGTLSDSQKNAIKSKTIVPSELHNIHVGTLANGTVTAPETAYSRARVSLTANYSPYYLLVVKGETSGDEIALLPTENSTYTFFMPAEDVTITIVGNFHSPTDLEISDVSFNNATANWSGNAPAYNLRYRIKHDPIVTLTAGDVWGDGSGYQMLLDANATAYGTIIPTSGGLTNSGDATAEVYNAFEYKIPENADGACSTQNMVLNNSVSIQIPAGTYDWCITNPTPGEGIWIASGNGNVGGRKNNFVFEAGKVYEFTVSDGGSSDRVDLTINSGATAAWNMSGEWIVVSDITSPYTMVGLDEDAYYEVQVQSVYESEGIVAEWSPSVFFGTATHCIAPSELNVSNLTPASVTLNWTGIQESYNVKYRTTTAYFFEDFEDGEIPAGWTIYAQKQHAPGEPWTIHDHNSYYVDSPPYSNGHYGVISWSFLNHAYDVDNWLITPQVELRGTLKFWVTTGGSSYHAPDEYQVLLSLGGNEVDDFDIVLQDTTAATEEWQQISIDLSSYAGQRGYIAIRHIYYYSKNLIVDDIGLFSDNLSEGEWVNVSSDRPTLTINGLTSGIPYEWQVQGNYDGCDGGVTPWSELSLFTPPEGRIFTTDGNWNVASNWTPTGVPTSDDDVYIAAAATIPSEYIAYYKSITIEDGGQLRASSSLPVTVQKSVDANKWYAISAPVINSGTTSLTLNATNLTNGIYDLFGYNETTGTWINQKAHNDFALVSGQGYIYRRNANNTLTFEGVTNVDDVSVTLTVSEAAGELKGFNLVGNPYPHNVTLNRAFYSLEADGTWAEHTNGGELSVGQSALVHVNSQETLIYYADTRSTNPGTKGYLPPLPKGLCLSDECYDNSESGNSQFSILNSQFAYVNGDQIIITGTGTLQVFDILGRQLFIKEITAFNSQFSISNFPSSGVYILRLNEKTQKIVVR